jgi:TonB family protein
MNAQLALVNIGAFAMQVTVLVVAGALLARLFRLDAPRVLLAYWRGLLLACLLLPLCQPWISVSAPVLTSTTIATRTDEAGPSAVLTAVGNRPFPARSNGELALFALASGVVVRLLWLAIGAYGLCRLRRKSVPLDPLPASLVRAQDRVGAHAAFSVSEQVSGPITFGVRRPAIVFPPTVCAMPAHVQEAIAYHELLHVRRHDWLHEILEHAVTCVLWFHPAIWLLIARIRLVREEVVDQAAIALTESREHYVESLLTVARASLCPSFTPASSFMQRHLLKTRVARIFQESTMTTRRVIASLTVTAAALALCAMLAVRAFPLEAQSRSHEPSDEPITLIAGGEHLLHGERPEYPRRAIEHKVEGDVVVDMTLNDRGEVSDARVLSGPEELRKATLESVLQWHYSPAALSSTETQATFRFRLPPPGTELKQFGGKIHLMSENTVLLPSKLAAHRLEEIEKALADPATTEKQEAELKALAEKTRNELEAAAEGHESGARESKLLFKMAELEAPPKFEGTMRLVDVRTERISAATAKDVLAQAGIGIGDSITAEAASHLAQTAFAMDEHFRVEFEKMRDGLVATILTR